MSESPQAGDLIEIGGDAGAQVALVLAEDRKKLRLLTEAGIELLQAPKPGWRVLGRRSVPADRDAAAAVAARVAQEIVALQSSIELESVWELLVDEGGRYSLAELCELALGDAGPLSQAALARAIEAERTLFRAKREDYEPSTRRQVEETRRQRELAEERARQRNEGIEALKAALGRAESDPPLAGHDDLVDLLVGMALHGVEAPRAGAASELLAALGFESGKEPQYKAFDALVRLGRFGRDENLWILRHGLPTQFRPALLEQAEAIARSARPWEEPDRVDLRHLLTVAIDDPETTEVDDALSLEPLPGGAATVWVHIADPGAALSLGDDLWREAQRRGTTHYLPDRKITLFPRPLAEGLFSLQEGQERAALSLRAQISGDGDLLACDFVLSRIVVDAQLSYEEADRLAEERGPLGDLLHGLFDIAQGLEAGRRAEGALILNGPEVKVRCSADGRVSVRPVDRLSLSRPAVAEMMILVGASAARIFAEHRLPAAYRCQDPPDEELQLPEGLLDAATHHAAVRRLRRAEIGPIPGRHAGLGVSPYVQISSPIRRYGDLLLQAQLKHFLRSGEALLDEETLRTEVSGVEATQSTATLVERESNRYWTLRYLQSYRGARLVGCVLEERNAGHYSVELVETCLRVNVEAPAGLGPGTEIELVLGTVDPRRDRISLRFAGLVSEAGAASE